MNSFHFWSGTSSGRTCGEILSVRSVSRAVSLSTLQNSDNTLTNCFRFDENPFLIRIKKSDSLQPSFLLVKKSREICSICKIAESTFGGGLNAPAGTFAMIFGLPNTFTERERILSLLFRARMRSATSF